MKRYITKSILALAAGMSLASCSDLLDVEPRNKISDEAVWSNLDYANSFLNNCYTRVEGDNAYGVLFANYSDETYHRAGYATEVYTLGSVSCDNYNVGYTDAKGDTWNYYYKGINYCNTLLEKIQSMATAGDNEKQKKDLIIGQAYFLRAFFYHQLYSLYGRVPLIYRTFDIDSEWTQQRAAMDEVADSVVADCDRAAALLPVEYESSSDFGRATKGAALAVKARTLLYKASPLFDEQTGGKSAERWQAAAKAQKAIIDMADNDGVYRLAEVSNYKDYADLFTRNAMDNPEVIFEKLYDANTAEIYSQSYPMAAPPGNYNGYHGWGIWLPTYNAANLYENADGTKFEMKDVKTYTVNKPEVVDDKVVYHPTEIQATTVSPFEGREMRFAANILYDGAMWGYGDDSHPLQIFEAGDEGVNSGEQSPTYPSGEYWNATQTGYYMRKFTNEYYDQNGTLADNTPWIFFRLAEFYLNYAECQIELGNNAEALKYINKVRNRVHLPDATGKDIRAEYEYERSAELMFEGQRFFDLRRWKRMETAYAGDNLPTALKIYKLKDGTLLYTHDKTVLQQRKFKEAMYWMPVPRYELNKCPNLDAKPYE